MEWLVYSLHLPRTSIRSQPSDEMNKNQAKLIFSSFQIFFRSFTFKTNHPKVGKKIFSLVVTLCSGEKKVKCCQKRFWHSRTETGKKEMIKFLCPSKWFCSFTTLYIVSKGDEVVSVQGSRCARFLFHSRYFAWFKFIQLNKIGFRQGRGSRIKPRFRPTLNSDIQRNILRLSKTAKGKSWKRQARNNQRESQMQLLHLGIKNIEDLWDGCLRQCRNRFGKLVLHKGVTKKSLIFTNQSKRYCIQNVLLNLRRQIYRRKYSSVVKNINKLRLLLSLELLKKWTRLNTLEFALITD